MYNVGKLWTEFLSPWVTVGLLFLLLTMGLVSTKMVLDVTRTADLRAISYSRLSALRQVLSFLRDTQSSARAYVITGREEYLQPHLSPRDELNLRLTELRELAADDAQQTTYTRVLESIAREQLEELELTVDARRQHGFEAAARQADSDRGHRLMAAMQTVAAAMEQADLAILHSRLEQFRRQRQDSLIALWTLIALATVATSAAAWQLGRDIRRLRSNEHVLEFEATHDALTGLLNRRGFEQALQQVIAQSSGTPASQFSLVVADLDHFKDINDRLGHQAGDQVLMVVAARLRDGFRDADVVARVGGEEFAALLRGLDPMAAVQIAERVRENVAGTPVNLGGTHKSKTAPITISLGVAAFPQDGTSGAGLFHAADQALYKAKNAGRNRVVSAASESEATPGPL
jgi:diguanylate cyclase (GGDEF)-like protein